MPLANGTRLGPYEITAPIGAGGMGEVYKATDTRLDRTVAIKVLPAHLAANAEFRQRFDREARAVSSLNHPNICVLHDIGRQDGIDFLVMEYLEGETLAARLRNGPLPTPALLECAGQIAEALAAAHRQGVYHRDLKPGNVMLTATGAKLLDFGLAKFGPAPGAQGQGVSLSMLPTQAIDLTQRGAVMGTFQYMSPEQLAGKDADARSDLWSFGAVLYEMATGRKAFEGKSTASVIAAILDSEPPPITTLQPICPPLLDHIARKCLEKDPDKRWQSARDASSALGWVRLATEPSAAPSPIPQPPSPKLPWVLAAALALLLAAGSALYFRQAPAEVRVTRFFVEPPPTTRFMLVPVVSPDGRRLAVTVVGDGPPRITVRSFDSLTTQILPSTEQGFFPFWSPDSRSFGFFADGKLKKIEIGGGPPQTLCDAALGSGAWSQQGVILFSETARGLLRVSASGGVPAFLPGTEGRRSPHFLPDGRHYLFFVRSRDGKEGVSVGALDSPDATRLMDSSGAAIFAPSAPGSDQGHLLFLRDQTLMAQPFDAANRRLAGDPFPVAESISASRGGGLFSASSNGALAYRAGPGASSQLVWFDRQGGAEPGALIEGLGHVSLSPDEKRVAFTQSESTQEADVWLLDPARNVRSRLTFDAAAESYAVWSPDGSRVAFASNRDGVLNLYVKAASGAGNEELLLKTEASKYPSDWSRDDRYIVYTSVDPKTRADLWVLPLSGDHKPQPFLRTRFSESHGQVSPDGRFLAYESDETGQYEVYVRPFPSGTGGRWQVSSGGGGQPRWRRDGKELFFLSAKPQLMAAEVKTGAVFETSTPRPLFDVRVGGHYARPGRLTYDYAPSADGKRFIFVSPPTQDATPVTVVLNWAAGKRP